MAGFQPSQHDKLIAVRTDEPLQGHWWLPEQPDERLYGQLERSGSRWQVSLGGQLSALTDGEHIMLHGNTATGTEITVFDAFWTSSRAEQTVLSAPAYLEGVHLPGRDELVAMVCVEIPEAVQLLDHEPELAHAGSTTTATSIRRTSGPVILPDGTTLEVVFSANTRPNELTRAVTVEPKVVFQFLLAEPAPIAKARETYAFAIRDFVGFGTLARVSQTDTRFALPSEHSPEFALRNPPSEPDDQIAVTKRSDRLLQLGADDDVADVIARWFGIYFKYRMAITLLLAPLQAREMYGELRLSTAFMAMESFQDKKFSRTIPKADRDPMIQRVLDKLHKEPDLVKFAKARIGGGQKGLTRQLNEVVDYSGAIGRLIGERLPRFRQRLISARGRNVAHPGEWNSDDRHGLELYFLNVGLRWVLVTCLVRELGYNDTEAATVVKKCSHFSTDLALFHHLGPNGTARPPPPL
jgi:hypothetical protein